MTNKTGPLFPNIPAAQVLNTSDNIAVNQSTVDYQTDNSNK